MFSSCVYDETGTQGDEVIDLRIELNSPSSSIAGFPKSKSINGDFQPVTRAITDQDEVNVERVCVFLFRKSTKSLYAVAEGKNIVDGATGSGSSSSSIIGSGTAEGVSNVKTFNVSFKIEKTLADAEFECVVLTNLDSNKYKIATLENWKNKSYTEVSQLLSTSITSKLYPTSPTSMVMWGIGESSIIPSSYKPHLEVKLLRSVARVDVRVMPSASDFDFKELYVYKPNDKMAFVPSMGNYSKANHLVNAPTLVAGVNSAISTPWKYTEIANGAISPGIPSGSYTPISTIEKTVYIPESNTTFGGGPEIYSGDVHHTERCAIVVGGVYKGSMNYYRIDFKRHQLGGEPILMDVLRNHKYLFNITSIEGGGESTPDDAYESRSASITTTVLPWNDNNQDIIFDGTSWVSVERKKVYLPHSKNAEESICVRSNVAPSSWVMSMKYEATPTDREFDSLTKLDRNNFTQSLTSSSSREVDGHYFKIIRPEDGASDLHEGYLTIRSLQENSTVKNVDYKIYKEILQIKIKRLVFEIEISQYPELDTPWNDGGIIDGQGKLQ